jgi:Tol biopolymer transport system component
VGTGSVIRVTTAPKDAEDCYPAWSRDGRFIAFHRNWGSASGYYVVPALGGAERRIGSAKGAAGTGMAWTPDGKSLVVSTDAGGTPAPPPLMLIDPETGEQTALTAPPSNSEGDHYQAFSPDGKTLAFVRMLPHTAGEIYLMSWPNRQSRRLYKQDPIAQGLAWMPDGRSIIFASGIFSTDDSRLWRLSVKDGRPVPITAAGQSAYNPTVAPHGDRLAYVQGIANMNIWRLELNGATRPTKARPTKLISSTRVQLFPQYSPDGKKLAFYSNRSGNGEIWVGDAEGQSSFQLTKSQSPHTAGPAWSPDGSLIAFDSRPYGHADVFVVRSDGALLRRLTMQSAENVRPSWTRDGKWVYFSSDRTGTSQIWKVPANGLESPSNPAIQVTHGGGYAAMESPDAKYLYFTKSRENSALWRKGIQESIDAGEEPVSVPLQEWGQWTCGPNGIFFFYWPEHYHQDVRLKFLDLVTKRIHELARIEKPIIGGRNLTLSPDGRYVAYSQIDNSGSDIMLVENFR